VIFRFFKHGGGLSSGIFKNFSHLQKSKDNGRPPSIFLVAILSIASKFGTVANLRRSVNRHRDITIFRCSKWRLSVILHFQELFSELEYLRWQTASILKIETSLYLGKAASPIDTKFGTLTHLGPL